MCRSLLQYTHLADQSQPTACIFWFWKSLKTYKSSICWGSTITIPCSWLSQSFVKRTIISSSNPQSRGETFKAKFGTHRTISGIHLTQSSFTEWMKCTVWCPFHEFSTLKDYPSDIQWIYCFDFGKYFLVLDREVCNSKGYYPAALTRIQKKTWCLEANNIITFIGSVTFVFHKKCLFVQF